MFKNKAFEFIRLRILNPETSFQGVTIGFGIKTVAKAVALLRTIVIASIFGLKQQLDIFFYALGICFLFTMFIDSFELFFSVNKESKKRGAILDLNTIVISAILSSVILVLIISVELTNGFGLLETSSISQIPEFKKIVVNVAIASAFSLVGSVYAINLRQMKLYTASYLYELSVALAFLFSAYFFTDQIVGVSQSFLFAQILGFVLVAILAHSLLEPVQASTLFTGIKEWTRLNKKILAIQAISYPYVLMERNYGLTLMTGGLAVFGVAQNLCGAMSSMPPIQQVFSSHFSSTPKESEISKFIWAVLLYSFFCFGVVFYFAPDLIWLTFGHGRVSSDQIYRVVLCLKILVAGILFTFLEQITGRYFFIVGRPKKYLYAAVAAKIIVMMCLWVFWRIPLGDIGLPFYAILPAVLTFIWIVCTDANYRKIVFTRTIAMSCMTIPFFAMSACYLGMIVASSVGHIAARIVLELIASTVLFLIIMYFFDVTANTKHFIDRTFKR